jgi:hypothetical protein
VIFLVAKQFQIRKRQGPQQKTVTWQDWVVGHLTDTEAVTVRVEYRGIVGGGINRQERFWNAAMDF